MQTHKAVAHFTIDFGLGYQCGNGVDDHHIQGTGANQGFRNFQCLLAGIRLGDVQLIDVHAQLLGIGRIQGVLCIHEGRNTACTLGFCYNVQGNGGFTGRLRSINLHNTSPGNTANAQGCVQRQAAGGNDRDILVGYIFAQLHHSTLAVLLVQICQCMLQCLQLFLLRVIAGLDCFVRLRSGCFFRRHDVRFPPNWFILIGMRRVASQ